MQNSTYLDVDEMLEELCLAEEVRVSLHRIRNLRTYERVSQSTNPLNHETTKNRAPWLYPSAASSRSTGPPPPSSSACSSAAQHSTPPFSSIWLSISVRRLLRRSTWGRRHQSCIHSTHKPRTSTSLSSWSSSIGSSTSYSLSPSAP